MRKLANMAEIIGWKHNHQSGMATDGGVIIDFPGGIPSDEDIDTWKTEYDAHISATAYIEKRLDAYPNIGDQLDAVWKQLNQDRLNGHAMIQQVDDMIASVLKVKSDNPKPD